MATVTLTAIKASKAGGYAHWGSTWQTTFQASRWNQYGIYVPPTYGNDVGNLTLACSAWHDSSNYNQKDAYTARGHVAFTIPNLSGAIINSVSLRLKPGSYLSDQTVWVVKNLTGQYTGALNNYSDNSNGGAVYAAFIPNTGSLDAFSIALTNYGTDIPFATGGTFKLGLRLGWDYYGNLPSNNPQGCGADFTGALPELIIDYAYPAPPAAPVLSGYGGGKRAVLSWTTPASPSPILNYKLYRANLQSGPFTLVTSPLGNAYTELNLVNGQSYWYKVVAVNIYGDSPDSNVLEVVPTADLREFPPYLPHSVDRLGYHIFVAGTDYARFFTGGTTTGAAGSLGQAEVNLKVDRNMNVDAWGVDAGVTVEATRDGGVNWTTLFDGNLNSSNIAESADGKRTVVVQANNMVGLRNLYLTANQCSVGPCDVGTVFIGSFADRNGDEWLNDAEGNYPNGLLYRTGYEYSYESVKDLFEGSMSVTASVTTSVTNYDLPSLVTLNGRNISEAIDTVVGTIGLVYFFDDDLKEFRVYQDSALKDFPQAPYTFEEGKDIATVQYGLDGTQVVTRVTVIGSTPDLFYSTGTGARETIITDTSLTSLEACQVKAVQYLAAFAQSRTVGKFRCAPIDVPVLGYNVNTVSRFGRRDANGNWVTTSANVVGVTHNFGPDHWFTELDLESTRNTIPRTLVEIQDEITKGNNTTDSPVAYLSIVGNGVLPDAATMSNICAIGVGSSSDETSLMRAIVQVSAAPYVPKAGGPTVTAASISNQFGGRVRELGVYMNNLTNGACVDATMSVQIPTGSALFGAFVEQAQGVYLGNIAETYPLGATSIAVNPTSSNDAWFWMKAQDVSALRVVAMSDTDYGGMTSYWQFPDAGAPWENTLHCTLAQEEEVSRMGSLAPAIPFNRQVDIAPSQWQGPGGIIALYMDFALVVPNDKWEAVKELIVNLDACHVDINAIDTYTGVGTWNIWNTGVPTPRWDPIYTITSSRIDGGSGNLDPHAFSFPFPNEHTASNQAQYVAPDGHVRLAFRMDGYANTEIQGPALAVDFNHVGLAYKLDRSKCTDYRFYKGTTWAPWDNNRHGYVMPELPGRSEIVDYRFNYKEVLEGHTASFDVSIKNFLDFYGLPVYTPGILTSYSGAPKGSVTAVLTDRLLMASYGKWDDGSISQAVVPVSPLNPREYIDYGNEGYDQIDWGIGLNLQDGLVRAGGIQVLYTYSVGDVLDMEPPNNPGPTYFPMKYTSNDMRAANICMSTGNLCVEPGVPLSIAYKAVGGELAKRFVVGPETRIDQGIGKDASTTIHVSAEMALGHVDGSTGIIGGPGVALPGAR